MTDKKLSDADNRLQSPSRRDFLKTLGIAGAATTVGTGTLASPRDVRAAVKTNARIVIVGAGAGGMTAAAKLNKWLDGAKITLIEPRETHLYQPGWVFVGSGVKPKEYTTDHRNADLIPDGVDWVKDHVAAFEPEHNRVITVTGEKLEYDYLIVATGLQLNYDHIDGLSPELLGKNGLVSVYAGPRQAEAMWTEMQTFVSQGGQGIFTLTNTPLKCAGAPLKMAFLTWHRMQESGKLGQASFTFNSGIDKLFGVKPINDLAAGLFKDKGFEVNYNHVLKAVDAQRKQATFATAEGDKTVAYNFLHVVPPMSAPDVVKNSPLAWQESPYAAGGWVEVDQHKLQHKRFDNVFAIGDVAGVPIGKTAASVKFQSAVACENLVSLIEGKAMAESYNGYTSCPLVTGLGEAALVEFDYSLELTPTFPLVDQSEPRWMWWAFDLYAIKPYYFQMLKGRIPT